LLGIRISTLSENGSLWLDGHLLEQTDLIRTDRLDQLEWRPNSNFHGHDETLFQFKVVDTGHDWLTSGGRNVDKQWRSFSADISSVTTSPQGHDIAIEMKEDATYRFSADDFKFSDGDGDHFKSIIIDSLPVDGTLELNGDKVRAGDEISVGNIGRLTFTPDENLTGEGRGLFTFSVRDDSGADDGLDTDQTPNTVSFSLDNVVDTFTGTDKADRIAGTDAKDILDGLAGNDVISAGAGNDLIKGGAGNDRFVFKDGFGFDTIQDFNTNGDVIDFRGSSVFESFDDIYRHHMYQAVGGVAISNFEHGKELDVLLLAGAKIQTMSASDFLF
jgi:Ca2+-binding RTX toxin-like protein